MGSGKFGGGLKARFNPSPIARVIFVGFLRLIKSTTSALSFGIALKMITACATERTSFKSFSNF